jgi:20S proteasome subunit alpha 6
LITHGLHALRETLQQDKALSTLNTSIGIIGPAGAHEQAGAERVFRIIEGDALEPYLASLPPKEAPGAGAATPAGPATAVAGDAPPADEDVQMQE